MAALPVGPSIGWFMLSEADRRAANRYLSKLASDGTRDELGFAPIHFAFADRFFPGTSVQHAQLRYVFFVAWAYQELLAATAGQRFSRDALFDIEQRYSRRLMRTVEELENSGISGWMKYRANERPVVRASTIYWTALRSWRMAHPVGGIATPPTEAQLQRAWPRLVTMDDGDEGKPSFATLFDDLPQPPSDWLNKTGKLDFTLRKQEGEYLRRKWKKAGHGDEPPLLSKLVEAGVTTESLWSASVRRVTTPAERHALVLAERAASVACVARAAHSALIEAKRNEERGLRETCHADALPQLISKHREAAMALDIEALRRETAIDAELVRFIGIVTEWLRDERPLRKIAHEIAFREQQLKGGRAYLASEKRRTTWQKGIATPLDYRWPTVRAMIACVREAT